MATMKIKARESMEHICKCHLSDRRNLVHVQKLDDLLLISLARPVAELASKKTQPNARVIHIQTQEGETVVTYPYMVMRER